MLRTANGILAVYFFPDTKAPACRGGKIARIILACHGRQRLHWSYTKGDTGIAWAKTHEMLLHMILNNENGIFWKRMILKVWSWKMAILKNKFEEGEIWRRTNLKDKKNKDIPRDLLKTYYPTDQPFWRGCRGCRGWVPFYIVYTLYFDTHI